MSGIKFVDILPEDPIFFQFGGVTLQYNIVKDESFKNAVKELQRVLLEPLIQFN